MQIIKQINRTGRINRNSKEFTEQYFVETDQWQADPQVIYLSPGIPSVGDFYFSGFGIDPQTKCTDVDITTIGDDPKKWLVTVTYQRIADPLPSVSVRFETVETPVTEVECYSDDTRRTRVACQSTAGDPFLPVPTVKQAELVFTVQKVIIDPFFRRLARDYNNHVNAGAFGGFSQEELFLTIAGLEPLDPIEFLGLPAVKPRFLMTCELRYRYNGHQLRPLNQGTYQLVGGVKTKIEDKGGSVGMMSLLDANGAETTTPHYLEFFVYKRAVFQDILGDVEHMINL